MEVFRKEIRIIGSRRASAMGTQRIMALLASGALKPVLDSALPLESAAEAHRRLADRRHFGKLILVP